MRTRPYATRCFSGLFHQTLRKTSGAPVPASCPSSGCGISTLVGFSFSPNVMKTSPPLSRMPFASSLPEWCTTSTAAPVVSLMRFMFATYWFISSGAFSLPPPKVTARVSMTIKAMSGTY